MKIAIGNDHAAVELKKWIMEEFLDVDFINVGTDKDESVDYTDYSYEVCKKVNAGEAELGILICGTGTGMAISANKVKGIRAAMCYNEMMAEYAKRHNNANVLAIGARVMGDELAKRVVRIFLNTPFDGGRHERRVNKITKIEEENL
ncbi:MAG: ribose 5-phosphate isomerase B [Candidatus Muiribacterium halophilum]|uniref:Ribose 5-phosphate isomerase B n=1 Tax=Muiribacterium halophilum TaxID=2053465 RepID=A0A2N5ZEB5_MUIH1|nr:MAG: ribose 5-phosphate isomerase B [Candidatus Muirbacterium halophilum]